MELVSAKQTMLPMSPDIDERNREKFDATWRADCYVAHIGRDASDWMIRRHYLGKWPGVCVCTLGMMDRLRVVGMVVFALPPLQTNTRYGGETWELARLWIDDAVPKNGESWLIGQAVKHVRKHHTDVHMLVSYADPSRGHSGTIYRASNWLDDGMTSPSHVDYSDGVRKYSRYGHVPDGVPVFTIPRISKHRFTYRLQEAA